MSWPHSNSKQSIVLKCCPNVTRHYEEIFLLMRKTFFALISFRTKASSCLFPNTFIVSPFSSRFDARVAGNLDSSTIFLTAVFFGISQFLYYWIMRLFLPQLLNTHLDLSDKSADIRRTKIWSIWDGHMPWIIITILLPDHMLGKILIFFVCHLNINLEANFD